MVSGYRPTFCYNCKSSKYKSTTPLCHVFQNIFLSQLLVAPFINRFGYTPTPLMKLPKSMACKQDYKI